MRSRRACSTSDPRGAAQRAANPADRLRVSAEVAEPGARDHEVMLSTGTPLLTTGVLLFVSFLLVLSGHAKKRLVFKSAICPICHHERKRCTCRCL